MPLVIGLFLVATPDISGGLLIAHFIVKFAHLTAQSTFYLWGVFFALLPDVDFLRSIIKAKMKKMSVPRDSETHRWITHWPLIMLPLCGFLAGLFSGYLAVLALLCLLFHFCHDSIGSEIQWLAPIAKTKLIFFVADPVVGKRFFVVIDPKKTG